MRQRSSNWASCVGGSTLDPPDRLDVCSVTHPGAKEPVGFARMDVVVGTTCAVTFEPPVGLFVCIGPNDLRRDPPRPSAIAGRTARAPYVSTAYVEP